MKINLALLFVFIFMVGCEKIEQSPSKSKAYYNFESNDQIRIPDYSNGQVLIYKNENGQQIQFKVTSVNFSEKEIHGVGMGFFGPYASEYFFYDMLNVGFRSDSGEVYSISYLKWPIDEELAKEDSYVKRESDLIVGISHFPYWNKLSASGYPEYNIPVNSSYLKVTLTINEKTYYNVLRIFSGNYSPLSEKQNVNVLYYLDGIGIIGFDDLEKNHWRLQ